MTDTTNAEREQFEAWAKPLELSLERKRDTYATLETALIWEGWQARAAISPPPQSSAQGALASLDEAFAAEIQRVSHIEYDSHEICKHFYAELRAKFATLSAQHPQTPSRGNQKELKDRTP